MPKQDSEAILATFLKKILYATLYGLINFFIFIGEATTNAVLGPFRLVFFLFHVSLNGFVIIGKLVEKFVALLSHAFIKVPRNYFRRLSRIRFSTPKFEAPKLRLPRIKFRKPLINLPKISFPKLSLPKFTFPTLPKIVLPSLKVEKPQRKLKAQREEKIKTIKKASVFHKVRYFIIGFLTAAIIVSAQQAYVFVDSLPSPKSIGKVNYSLTTHILDRNGKVLYEVYRDQNRTPVRLGDLPKYTWEASIAMEDKEFFRHNGVSIFGGIIRAAKETFLTKNLQGGSTITQQLVKSALLTPERTVERKVKEIILALWAERLYSKERILEMYLNQVPYGGSSYGIEEASKTYFEKSAKDISLSEAAMLAGLPQAPSIYSPFVNPNLAKSRRDEVLKHMLEQRYITEEEYLRAKKEPLAVVAPKTNIKAPHFVFYVKGEMEKQFGIRNVEEGGLKVNTTLDLNLNEKVQDILITELEKIKGLNVSNGAVLVTRPSTGEVLAMVGSADYFAAPSGAFNVTTALRQPGSSIKPLMYSLALSKGFTSASVLDDSPVTFSLPGETYKPVNYDGRFHGRIPLRYALANSYNIPAVRTLNVVGVDNFVEHARNMGISTWSDPSRFGLSLTLGGGEVKMTDMAKAFGVFANLGKKTEISPLLRVQNNFDETTFELKPDPQEVLDEGVSYIMSDILSDNVARQQAFGARSALEIPGYKVAVKTGTTDSKKDNWTIGYTPEYMVVVWVGNNNNTPMHPSLTSGITGAAPIWNKVMTYLLSTYSNKNSWFNKPESVVEKNCYGGRTEVFVRGTENVFCQMMPRQQATPSATIVR